MLVVMDLSPYRNWLLQRGQFPYDAAAWNAYLDFVGRHYQNEAVIAYYAIRPPRAVPRAVASGR
jgi:hypothetical protein